MMMRKTGIVLVCAMGLMVACIAAGGRDVPYVPTPHSVVEAMLEMAQVQKTDTVYDLGSGDGRIVIAAIRDRGAARGVGVDIDPERITESNENARKANVADRVEFLNKNLFEMDLSKADVVTLYLLPSINVKLRPKLFAELRPGVRVVSHAFDMGDWKADAHRRVDGRDVYLWIIPANVEGRWKTQLRTNGAMQEATLELKQEYQEVSGVARIGNREVPLKDAKLVGGQLTFSIDDARYTAQVLGKEMTGTLAAGQAQPAKWSANRL